MVPFIKNRSSPDTKPTSSLIWDLIVSRNVKSIYKLLSVNYFLIAVGKNSHSMFEEKEGKSVHSRVELDLSQDFCQG